MPAKATKQNGYVVRTEHFIPCEPTDPDRVVQITGAIAEMKAGDGKKFAKLAGNPVKQEISFGRRDAGTSEPAAS